MTTRLRRIHARSRIGLFMQAAAFCALVLLPVSAQTSQPFHFESLESLDDMQKVHRAKVSIGLVMGFLAKNICRRTIVNYASGTTRFSCKSLMLICFQRGLLRRHTKTRNDDFLQQSRAGIGEPLEPIARLRVTLAFVTGGCATRE